jgi:Leucine-rich repeat (LRR) protein
MFDLTTCKYIESLRTLIGQLQHLTKLQLTNCQNFKQFPQNIASLSSLSMLDLSAYKSIESLPITINQLQHLTKLLFRRCENLKGLP